MLLTFELIFILLFVLYFISNTESLLTLAGKERNKQTQNEEKTRENVDLNWPKGIVTYYFDNATYDNFMAEKVRISMNVLESASCVKFKLTITKPAGNMQWIHFTNPQGERNCIHEPKFKANGEIILVLGFDCLKEQEILHSLLHAIGFKDEVSHPQRDQYVRVMWNNIQPEYRHLYRIRANDKETSQVLVEYDPLSIMHFHDRAFSMNGQATVMPLVPGLLISPSDGLSQLDKMRLRLLFDHECNKRKVGDMIDTCKMLLSNNKSPKDSKSTKKDKSKNKPSESDTADRLQEANGNENDEDVNSGDNIEDVDEAVEVNDSIEMDNQTHTELKSSENQEKLKNKRADAAGKVQPLQMYDIYGFGLG